MFVLLPLIVGFHVVVATVRVASLRREGVPISGPIFLAVVSTSVPIAAAAIMLLVFSQAGSVVQFNVGSESSMKLWVFWVDAFIPLFILAFIWSFGHLICMIGELTDRGPHSFRALAATGLVSSVWTLFSVGQMFPSV